MSGLVDSATESDVLAGVFPFPRLLLTHGAGSWVWDAQGRRYLDFTAGLGVLALGHGRRELAEVAAAQFTKLAHCSNLFVHQPMLDLAQALVASAQPWAKNVWLCNSGAEANEAALKFARLYGRAQSPGKQNFVAFERGFHGRTLGALAVTHEPAYREPFAPMLLPARFAPFNNLAAAAQAIDASVCAVVVEPVQGEGGVHVATPEFLRGLRALCDQHGAALILDEVQCGLGRTGELYAYEASGVQPDMMCLAKPLAGGLPLGAVVLSAALAKVLTPGQHGSTFGGGPVVCAVALEILQILRGPAFLAAVREHGAQLAAGLDSLCGPGSIFKERRGVGLMQALAIAQPDKHKPADLLKHMRDAGVLITRAGHDALRLLPPLNCTPAEIQQAVDTLAQVAQSVQKAAA